MGNETDKRKHLEKLNIYQLYTLCRVKRSIKKPFKKLLIDYLMELG